VTSARPFPLHQIDLATGAAHDGEDQSDHCAISRRALRKRLTSSAEL
jgi:hypothetical protein